MTYSEAQRKATNKYRRKNIERTRELNRIYIDKWRSKDENRIRNSETVLHKYHIKQEIKKIMLILIDENI